MKGKVRSFSVFKNFDHYVPTTADLFILLLWFVVGVFIGNIAAIGLAAVVGKDLAMDYSTVIAYPLMFIPPMIYAAAKSHSNSMHKSGLKLDSANFSPKGGALCALLAVIGTLALSFCTDAITSVMPDMPEWLEDMLKSMTQGNVWLNFICVSIFAPLFEEWLCRGMVLRGMLGNGVKPLTAIIISAAVFALIHANPWQAVPAFLLGALFGYVYYRAGSLRLTMLMHFANNTFALVMSNIDMFKDIDNWHEVFQGAQYWVIFGCCLIITALVVKAFGDIPVKRESGSFDEVPSLFEQ